MFMRYAIAIIVCLSIGLHARSQSAEDSVKQVINNLFTAMKNVDTTLLRSVFTDSTIFQTIARDREGNLRIRTDKAEGFVKSVGSLPKNAAHERISFGSVSVDGPLASVWTPYSFYYNGKFSHCGANSFQLVRMSGVWKIVYLIDTRRREGCTN